MVEDIIPRTFQAKILRFIVLKIINKFNNNIISICLSYLLRTTRYLIVLGRLVIPSLYQSRLLSYLRHCTPSGQKLSDSIISALSSLIFNFADNLEELYVPWNSCKNVAFTTLSSRYRKIPVRLI